MQQPAPSPAPVTVVSVPTQAAQGGAVTIYTPAPSGQLVGIPTSTEEIEGLRQRKEILDDQLQEVVERRDELTRELRNGVPEGQARTGIEQRIQSLDQRIMQLESDQAMTDRLLSNAPPHLLAQTVQHEEFDTSGYVDEDEAVFVGFMTFGAGVIISMILGRIRRRRYKGRSGGASAAAMAMANDPRIDKLTEAVEAIAEEVERIGEGQRFVTNLLAERREPVTLGRADGPR